MPTPRVVRRRRAIKAGMGLLVVLLMGVAVVRVYLSRNNSQSPEQAAGLTDQESEILGLVNSERIRAGLKPLKFSARLAIVARAHSYDMALRHYLSHQSPEGISLEQRLSGEGIHFQAAGENIYADDYRDFAHLAERALEGWLKSAEHRATLLSDKFTETGVGVAHSDDGNTYVTQDFVR
ncbi:MAG: CAP domain-containing protein [Candidatus Binataceae bacterium]